MARTWLAIGLLAIATPAARADDYPISYADRPLALPSTDHVAYEGTALAHYKRVTSYAYDDEAYKGLFLDLSARAAFSRFELDAAASVLALQTDRLDNGVYFPTSRLPSISGGARVAITPDLQMGADFTRLGEGASHDASRAFAAIRFHAAAGAAIDLGTVVAYERYSQGPNPALEGITTLILGAEARAIAQVDETVAIQARFALIRIDPIKQAAVFGPPYTDLTEDYGLGVIASLSAAVDIIVDAHFPIEGVTHISVGAAFRGLP